MPATLEAAEISPAMRDAVLREATRGLLVPAGTQKSLSPWLFYDERGSALFLDITRLPEYYLTRAERSIFQGCADQILGFARSPLTITELGSGTAEKTGLVLAAAAERQPTLVYQPIDVSDSALAEATAALQASIPNLVVKPQVANYVSDGFTFERTPGTSLLAMYIGSSIGNFTPTEAGVILRKVRKQLKQSSDALLLGVDLAPCSLKPVEQLIAAYDDEAGVTAEFNRNILVRLNREIGTDFDPSAFAHRARWNPLESRMEMHLESLIPQTVHLDGRTVPFAEGETIHTENSYKFTERSLRPMLAQAGFGSPHLLHDSEHRFAVALAHPA